MEDQIRSSITEDVELLRDANVTGGEAELVRFIRDAVATRSDKLFTFGLFRADGTKIAGNITSMPGFFGWGILDRELAQSVDDPDFIGYVETLDNNVIAVGRSQRSVAVVGDRIFIALVLAGVIICLSALAIGYLISRGVSAKLQVIDDTLGEVARGNSEIRVPVGDANDQIDHVSRQINVHLDRLSEFMTLMRHTIVAIAHDLKSPLNRASILLQETASSDDTGPETEKLERALLELDTLGSVLDTVLRISRIEMSDDVSSFAPFSIASVVSDLVQTFEPVVEAAGQSLVCTIAEDDGPTVFGDVRMVQQLLVNLIENASRHSGPGTRIEVNVATDDGAALISISDTGPGIAADKYAEVFQPFRRLAADRSSPGTGLGLALVRAIATRHHATIELSDNAPGLKVVVRFPPLTAEQAREVKVTAM